MSEFNPKYYYKTNLIIWGSIIIGMLMLIGITYYLDLNTVFEPFEYALEVKNILFIFILISALAVLFLKRSFLDFDKIYSKVKDIKKEEIETVFFNKLKINYIIIWAIAESIIVFGFIEYILLSDFKSFMIYAAIGLYAIGINFPKKSLFEKHMELLSEKQGNSNK